MAEEGTTGEVNLDIYSTGSTCHRLCSWRPAIAHDAHCKSYRCIEGRRPDVYTRLFDTGSAEARYAARYSKTRWHGPTFWGQALEAF